MTRMTGVVCRLAPQPSLQAIRVQKMGAEYPLSSIGLLGNNTSDACCLPLHQFCSSVADVKVSKQQPSQGSKTVPVCEHTQSISGMQPRKQSRFLFSSCLAEGVPTFPRYLLICLEQPLEQARNGHGLSVAPLSSTESRANKAEQLIQYYAVVPAVEMLRIPT